MVYAIFPAKIVAVSPRDGKTHRLVEPVSDLPDGRVTVLCGARVKARAGWGDDGWDAHMRDFARLGDTHETYTCARCAKRYEKVGF